MIVRIPASLLRGFFTKQVHVHQTREKIQQEGSNLIYNKWRRAKAAYHDQHTSALRTWLDLGAGFPANWSGLNFVQICPWPFSNIL